MLWLQRWWKLWQMRLVERTRWLGLQHQTQQLHQHWQEKPRKGYLRGLQLAALRESWQQQQLELWKELQGESLGLRKELQLELLWLWTLRPQSR